MHQLTPESSRDDGFTLIELLIALTVLAVGVLSVVGVFDAASNAAGSGGRRTRGLALATREAEAMRSVPYDRLGFAPHQAGFELSFEGLPTVQVVDPVVELLGPDEVVGGKTYSFERHIVWADATSATGSGTPYASAYKRVTVIVSWQDRGLTSTVRQDTIVYPGGRGPYVAPLATTPTTAPVSDYPPLAPTSLTAAVPADAAGATTVELSWVPAESSPTPVDSWVIELSTDNFLTPQQLTNTQPASSTTFAVTGLSPATSYQFRVAARASTGATSPWSPVAMATTSAADVATCQLGTSTVTPDALRRLPGAGTTLARDADVAVNTSGPCEGLHLSYNPSASTPTTVWLTPGSGGTWTGRIDGRSTSWDTGNHGIQVLDRMATSLGTLTLTVCVHNARSCP